MKIWPFDLAAGDHRGGGEVRVGHVTHARVGVGPVGNLTTVDGAHIKAGQTGPQHPGDPASGTGHKHS